MKNDCETLSIEEASRRIGICRLSGYRAAKTGELPVLRIGRRLRVPIAALDELLRNPKAVA